MIGSLVRAFCKPRRTPDVLEQRISALLDRDEQPAYLTTDHILHEVGIARAHVTNAMRARVATIMHANGYERQNVRPPYERNIRRVWVKP